MSQHWPTFTVEAGRFYDEHLRRPRRLLEEFTATGRGSGRRSGPRELLWQSVAASGIAALEAGLEDLVFAAHAARLACEGDPVVPGLNTPQQNPRAWLAESRLTAPGALKVERVVFTDFGLLLDTVPSSGRFTVMEKVEPNRGAGRGVARPGPTRWAELRKYLDTLAYVRNATAHADVGKLGSSPPGLAGALWLQKQDGSWSVQQPHGLTSLRVVLSIFNTIAEGLHSSLRMSAPLALTKPDTIDYPPR